jgi:hypothetical protein
MGVGTCRLGASVIPECQTYSAGGRAFDNPGDEKLLFAARTDLV